MYYIGVDLGGTNIAVGLVDETGKIISKTSTETLRERGSDEIIKDIADLSKKIIKDNNISENDVKSIGIGIPGGCDSENGIVEFCSNINFTNVNIRKELKNYFDYDIYIENDANCAAIGENFAGSSKGHENSIMITLGTGVGGGIIINKKIFRGNNGIAGEVGHIVIVVDGEQCGCTRRGCWEAYSSVTALIRMAKEEISKNKNSEIMDLCHSNMDKINGKIIFDAYNNSDEIATVIVNKYINYLCEGLANIINIFDPSIITIGGGLSAQGDKLINKIKENIVDKVYGRVLRCDIVAATLGNDAGIIGAAFLNKYSL